jgi:hypothetical protein
VPHLDAYYQSGTLNYLQSTTAASIPLDAYTILNASLTLNAQKWSLALLVRNLGNSKAISGVYPGNLPGVPPGRQFGSVPLYPDYFNFFLNTNGYGFFGNTTRELITTPRTIGLIAKYSF